MRAGFLKVVEVLEKLEKRKKKKKVVEEDKEEDWGKGGSKDREAREEWTGGLPPMDFVI